MNGGGLRISVVGAGRMGIGIAQAFAYAGHRVELVDIKERDAEERQRTLEAAGEQISGNLELLASLGLFDSAATPDILDRIGYGGPEKLEGLAADVVFEAVPEVLAIKQDAYARLGAAIGRDTLVASTTSTFLVDTLASFVKEPMRFLNTHWLNPAYLIPVVEVSPGQATAPRVLEEMTDLLESIGKVPVRCSASPGYIVPRVQALAMNEAARLVEEGVATAEDVDKASRLGFGLRFAVLGLLEFVDWGGSDTLYYASNYLTDALGTERFAPPEIVSQGIRDGNIGMKTGRGFHDFSERDVSAYQRETIGKFVDLLKHLGLLSPPGDVLLPTGSPSESNGSPAGDGSIAGQDQGRLARAPREELPQGPHPEASP
jgi:3-hydroxybutyryl-CoA dehydrogenase